MVATRPATTHANKGSAVKLMDMKKTDEAIRSTMIGFPLHSIAQRASVFCHTGAKKFLEGIWATLEQCFVIRQELMTGIACRHYFLQTFHLAQQDAVCSVMNMPK